MIEFIIKFLVCFTKPKTPVKKETTKKKKEKSPLSPKKRGELVKPSIEGELREEKNENIVECKENVRNWCHIEYSLLGETFPKTELNVVTWGAAAKIFTNDDCRAVKTEIIDDDVWVYFSMVHKICNLDNNQLEELKYSVITFRLSQNQENMMTRVVNDWPKEFIINRDLDASTESEKDINTSYKWFHELFQVTPPDTSLNKDTVKERDENYRISRPANNTVVSMLQVEPCGEKIEKHILDVMMTLPKVRESQEIVQKKGNKKAKKVRKGSKSQNKKTDKIIEDNFQLSLRAEQLIAGKVDVCAEQKAISPSLRYASVFVSASKIMTEEQDNTFVPLSVIIQSVEDLPMDFLNKLKLKNIYARYELANIISDVQTEKTSLKTKDVSFDDTRVYLICMPRERYQNEVLMMRPSVQALAEALLTRKFVVKLYGEATTEEKEVEPCLFGERSTDPFIATCDHSMFQTYKSSRNTSTEVFLGSAGFNLVELAKGYTTVETSSQVTSTSMSTWFAAYDMENTSLQHEQNKLDSILAEFTIQGAIPDSLLVEYCTRIKIKVSIGVKLSNLTERQLLYMINIVHRLIVVCNNYEHANNLFQRIKTYNSGLSEPPTLQSTLSYFGFMKSTVRETNNISLESRGTLSTFINHLRDIRKLISVEQKAITGFFIDNKEQSILVLEVIPYIYPMVIEPLNKIAASSSPDECRIIVDNSLFFTKRLYAKSFSRSLFTVSLQTPLSQLLKESSHYLQESLSKPEMQTLLLLDLLRRTPTLNWACVNQLFPSTSQLISFNSRFGDGSCLSQLNISATTM